MSLPRVLMLCHDTVHPFSGGGATLSSLFSVFPPENLFSIHNSAHTPACSRVGAQYRLNGRDLRYPQPVESARGLFRGIRRHVARAAQANGLAGRGWNGAGRGALRLVEMLAQLGYYRLPPHVMQGVIGFRPTLIYGWIADPVWMRTLRRLAGMLALPYVVHLMDNHVGVAPRPGWKSAAGAALHRREMDRVVANAAATLAISDTMADAYSAQWKRLFIAFHGVMRTAGWPRPQPRAPNSIFELAFTGSVERGQLPALLDVARATQQLAAGGIQTRLCLYLTEYYRERVGDHFSAFRHVRIHSHPDADGLRPALARADALILAYAFDRETIEYYRYSFATKLVPYMLSGTPVIAYGPPAIAPIAYASRGGWARVVTEAGADCLAEAVRELANDASKRGTLAALAYDAACREHNQEIVAPRFAEVLRAAANREAALQAPAVGS